MKGDASHPLDGTVQNIADIGKVTPGQQQELVTFLSVYGGQIPELNPAEVPSVRRRAQIEAALKADRVLTAGQLTHHLLANGQDLARLARVEHIIEPVHMRSTRVKVTFCALDCAALSSRPTVLAHTAATGEARLSLSIPPEHWRSSLSADDVEYDPDAVYTTPSGHKIAVEYDRGTYNKGKIVNKILAFSQAYDGIIWAVPPPYHLKHSGKPSQRSRQANVRNMIALNPDLRRIKKNILVMTTMWWHGADVIQH